MLLPKTSLSCVLFWAKIWGVLIFSKKHYQCHHFLWLPWKNEIIYQYWLALSCNIDNISPRKTKYCPPQGANIINVALNSGQNLFCYIKKQTKYQERIVITNLILLKVHFKKYFLHQTVTWWYSNTHRNYWMLINTTIIDYLSV